MRLYYYKDDNKKEIKKIDREHIAEDICKKVKTWSSDLDPVRDDYERINKEIFPDLNKYKEQIKLIPDVYEQFQTYKANIFKSTYQNYDGMFDIEGCDPTSHDVSAILKASLTYDFYKIGLKNTLDAMLDDWATKGECAGFVHWDVKVKRERNQSIQQEIDPDSGDVQYAIVNEMNDVVTHSSPDVKRIDPLNLFYDKSQRHNWAMCGKIIRDFIPLQYVLTNQSYNLTAQETKELKEEVALQREIQSIDEDKHNLDMHIVGNTVEVLEYRGDYIIPEKGDVARDIIITVIAGRYVAQVEESQYPICPIIYSAYLERPDSTRGQSPLKPTFLLNELENRCMDLQMEAWELTVNPPMIAPKGMIPVGQRLVAGRPFEYNYSTFDNVPPPTPMNFSAGMRGFDFQDFFKKKMEGATGITQYMQGSTGGAVRTASESTYIYSGQTTRLSREAYLFSEKIILPLVVGFYEMKKEFEVGQKYVPINKDGVPDFATIDDKVRKGDYHFMIGDAQTSVEREQYVERIMGFLNMPAVQTLVQRPEFPAMEFFKWVLNELNFRQINSLVESLGINDGIVQQGQQLGVQPNNMGGFVKDMKGQMQQSIPEFANMLAEQSSQGQIPQPVR